MREIGRSVLRGALLVVVGAALAGAMSPQCSGDEDRSPDAGDTCWNLYQPCLEEGFEEPDACDPWIETDRCPDLPNPECGHPYFHCQWESFETEEECRLMLAACNDVPVGSPCKDYFKQCLLADLGWGCEILFGGDCLSMTEETDCEEFFFTCFQWRNPASMCAPYLDGRSCPPIIYERAPGVYFTCLRHGFDVGSCDAVLASANRAGEVASCDALRTQCLADGIAAGICEALFGDCNFTPPGEPG